MWRLPSVLVCCLVAAHATAQAEQAPPDETTQTEESAKPAAEAPDAARSPIREAIDAGNYFFAKFFEARDAQSIAELYTEDARVIAPGATPASGRAEIAAFWAGAMQGTQKVRLETLSVESDGTLAFEEGVVELTANDGSTSAERYVVVWKRVGRRWHLHRDIWNTAPAAAEPAAAEPAVAPQPDVAPPEGGPSEAPLAPEEPT